MLEKIKEVPFIDESAAVKLLSKDGKLVLERNDRVIWASESTQVPADEAISCYVEAEKFFTLLPDIAQVAQDTCLHIKLKNDAQYELPFLTAEWQTEEMPEEYENTITFKLDDLMLCTLKNLVKPELQCIWIDDKGAVSCDFISACVCDTVKATEGFLLPPDVQALVNDRVCKVKVTDSKIYFQASDFSIITSKPAIGEDAWWEQLREMLSVSATYVKAEPLTNALKRLVMFADYVTFDGAKVFAGENFEPFAFKEIAERKYEIERLSRILTTAEEITEESENLVLKNKTSRFLISPSEDA